MANVEMRTQNLVHGVVLLTIFLACGGCDGLSRSCRDQGRTHDDGQTWTCSDGCNSCSCDDGVTTSTAAGCSTPPGPAANKRHCGGNVRHGTLVTCQDGTCCICDDGEVERAPGACGD